MSSALEHWKIVREHYTEHNPSVTISVGESEWIAVADWLYTHWDIVCGLSFLPRDNHVYRLAPYEKIDAAQYETLQKQWEHIDFSKIMAYANHAQGATEHAPSYSYKRAGNCV